MVTEPPPGYEVWELNGVWYWGLEGPMTTMPQLDSPSAVSSWAAAAGCWSHLAASLMELSEKRGYLGISRETTLEELVRVARTTASDLMLRSIP